MTEPIIKNPGFDVAGENAGDAESWSVSFVSSGPGFANFGEGGSLMPVEQFGWFGKRARVFGADGGPFSLSNLELAISAIDQVNDAFSVDEDVRWLLPPGSFIRVETTSGDDVVGAYWEVKRCVYDSGETWIFVEGDVYITGGASTTAQVVIPPIVFCDVDGYGWGARTWDLSSYPLGVPVPAGAKAYVQVNRGAYQEVTFAGGETTAADVAAIFDAQLVGASSGVEDGVPFIQSTQRGGEASLLVDEGTTGLSYPISEDRGRGQFAQLWELSIDDFGAATSDEIAAVFSQYWEHCWVVPRSSAAGGWIVVESEHQGAAARLKVYGPFGALMTSASWPVAARGPSNNTLDLELNVVHSVTVTFADGLTEIEDFAAAITTALSVHDTSAKAQVSGGQIFISSFGRIRCTGGTANADLGVPVGLLARGDRTALSLGFTEDQAEGEDGEHLPDWEDVPSIVALFGLGGDGDSFSWSVIYGDIDEAGSVPAEFVDWLTKLAKGSISSVVQASRTFVSSGTSPASSVYRSRSTIIVESSTGNDGEYTVKNSFDVGDDTHIEVVEEIPDGTADGTITPQTWSLQVDDFDSGWGTEFDDWSSPRLANGQVFGNPIEFPVSIAANRNILWLVVDTVSVYSLQVSSGDYSTPAALVAELNTQLDGQGLLGVFGFSSNDAEDGKHRLSFGKRDQDLVRHEVYFAVEEGRRQGHDIRQTIGFSGMSPSGSERYIVYPRVMFDTVNGVPVTSKDLDIDDSFLVDPYSRLVWVVVADVSLPSQYHIVENDDSLGVFNESEGGVPDSNVEDFIVDGWGGATIPVTLVPDVPEPGAVFSGFAQFGENLGPTVDYEDFEAGWL